MVLVIQPNSTINISSVQPHNITLSNESIDYLTNISNSSDLFKPVEIIKLDDRTYFSEDGDHRLYCLAKKGYDKLHVQLYDINNAEHRLLLAQNRREKIRTNLLIDKLRDSAKAFFEKMNPHPNISDSWENEIKKIENTLNFVRSEGIYTINNLEGKFIPTKYEMDARFNIKYMDYLEARNQ